MDGHPVGEHPLVRKLLRDIRLSVPPEPKYTSLWDVNKDLSLFQSWPHNKYLPMKQLSVKLAMLLCLLSCRRVSDFWALDITGRVFTPEGVLFHISRRTKYNSTTVSYSALQENPKLCIVGTIKAYEIMTEELRPHGEKQLLITLTKRFRPLDCQMGQVGHARSRD